MENLVESLEGNLAESLAENLAESLGENVEVGGYVGVGV